MLLLGLSGARNAPASPGVRISCLLLCPEDSGDEIVHLGAGSARALFVHSSAHLSSAGR